jgi:hypothetical protein
MKMCKAYWVSPPPRYRKLPESCVLYSKGNCMKRHFSNRGEALAEVTAGRGLADRKTSVRTAFMTQAGRRAKSSPWFSSPASQIPPQEGHQHKERMAEFLYEGVPKEKRNAIQREESFQKRKR